MSETAAIPTSGERWVFRNEGDDPDQTDMQRIGFCNFICRAYVGNVMMLHRAGVRAGYVVNGRRSFHPISFPEEIGAEPLPPPLEDRK